MKIIGYNSSHETSLCQFDSDTWELDFLYEEERFRRVKQWTPEPPQHQLLCIERKQIQTPDHFIGFSYDRREFRDEGNGLEFNKQLLKYNKKFNRELLSFIEKEQMTLERLKEFHSKYPQVFEGFDPDSLKIPNERDDLLHSTVAEQLDLEEYVYEIEHHLYHAECGYWFSPWREKESAIALVCDGGGAKLYHETHPNYQEVETVYLCQPDRVPFKQWQRMSNYRFMDDWGGQLFYEESRERCTAAPDVIEIMDGVETVFSSKPSMGQIFSALSLYFGFDRLGRAAGKVMGAASYQKWYEEDTYFDMSTYSLGNQLQQKAFEHTCAILQKAVDNNPDVKNIILSGGYALNCTNNAKYLERFPDHQIFVDPVAHDGGTAVGGAIRLARAVKQGVEI